jgi:hypothetical protein
VIRGQDDESQFAARKILVIPNLLIAGKEQVEPRLLGRVKQRAVLQPLLPQLIRPHYLMSLQKTGEWGRGIGIEQDLHATAAGHSREFFAKARTACTCSRLTDGNHSQNSSTVDPWSRCSNSAATGRRVPLKHHAPPSFPGFRSTVLQRLQSIGEDPA